MLLRFYRLLTVLCEPLIAAYLRLRLRRGKEDGARFGERQGRASLSRPQGRVIWMHAASVGEAISFLPLAERLQGQNETTVLLTSGTVTSAALMARRLPKGAMHQFVPVDCLVWVRRFLDHWRPDLALWAESEFWPNLLLEAQMRGVPLILVNGRVSARSFRRWRYFPGTIGRLLSAFSLCLGQTPEDTERLRRLGAVAVDYCGNLKYAAQTLPVDEAEDARLSGVIGGRPRWLAASTHAGEELLAGETHRALQDRHPGLLTIIVPRHPARGADIAGQLTGMGLCVARRSAGDPVTGDVDILIADTMGEMGLFYKVTPIVFMGKSLAGQGGQNPLEPARFGAAVLFGPHMDNFAVMAQAMLAAGAATEVDDGAALTCAVDERLSDPSLTQHDGMLARRFALKQASVLDSVMNRLQPWLAGLEANDEGA